MNIRQAAELLLLNFAPEERTIPASVSYPGRTADVIAACNGALQELYGEGMAWMRRRALGAKLRGPTQVTIAVTADSHEATITGYQSWMAGCGIVVNGGSVDNEITQHVEDEDVILLFPYDGSTGTTTALIYSNAIQLDSDVAGVLKPVRIANAGKLVPVTDPDKLKLAPSPEDDFNRHRLTPNPPLTHARLSDLGGTPQLYCVDSIAADDYGNPNLLLRVAPPPDRDMLISYRAVMKAPAFTIADLVAGTPPNIPMPLDYAESIFLPIARKRLMASSFFRDHSNKDVILSEYNAAHALARTLRPQKSSGLTMRPYFG